MCVYAWACVCATEKTTSVSMSHVLFAFFCVCILWQDASMVWHPLSSLVWLASDLQWPAYPSLPRIGLYAWITISGFFLIHVEDNSDPYFQGYVPSSPKFFCLLSFVPTCMASWDGNTAWQSRQMNFRMSSSQWKFLPRALQMMFFHRKLLNQPNSSISLAPQWWLIQSPHHQESHLWFPSL